MEIRNVQKTGDMHYVYLPTSWCRQHKLGARSKLGIEQGVEGNLIISPHITERKRKSLKLSIAEDDIEVINKLVVACYINPLTSFDITLEKGMDFAKLLNQKRLISLESVEIDRKKITSHGGVFISEPESLLKTMVKKVKNLITVMKNSYGNQMVERYEDEIDRSKMLIDKSVISALTFERQATLKTIDLYYISLISKDLERMVDHLIQLKGSEQSFFSTIHAIVEQLQSLVENAHDLSIKSALAFVKKVQVMKQYTVKDVASYDKERVRLSLVTISEVITDWAVTHEVEKE